MGQGVREQGKRNRVVTNILNCMVFSSIYSSTTQQWQVHWHHLPMRCGSMLDKQSRNLMLTLNPSHSAHTCSTSTPPGAKQRLHMQLSVRRNDARSALHPTNHNLMRLCHLASLLRWSRPWCSIRALRSSNSGNTNLGNHENHCILSHPQPLPQLHVLRATDYMMRLVEISVHLLASACAHRGSAWMISFVCAELLHS